MGTRTIIIRAATLCALVAARGCATSEPQILPTRGAVVSVETVDGNSVSGELLAVQDSFILLVEGSITSIRTSDVYSIDFRNGRIREWMGWSFIGQFCPAVGLAFADVSPDLILFATALPVATWFAMDLAEPPRLLYRPFNPRQIADIRRISRFPYGITQAAFEHLHATPFKGRP